MPSKTTLLSSACLAFAFMQAPAVLAEEKAHVHGHGKLNLAIDGEELEIELIAPGADIVGFEHEAKSDADKAAIEAGVAKLKDAFAVFGVPAAAKCELEEADIESALLGDEDHDHDDHKDDHGHKEEGHKADDHDHDHKEEAKDDDHDHDHGHKDEHAHGEEEGDTHSEFHAHYHFHCHAPTQLTHLDLGYFKQFPNAEELDVQAITASGQVATELNAKNARLVLK